MDLVVYGKHVKEARGWVNDYLHCGSERQDLKPLGDELCDMFLLKAEDESAGRRPPDLKERWRYHCRAEHGLPCYSDD